LALAVLVVLPDQALAAPQTLSATMNGAQETPANASVATGSCTASADPTTLQVTFSGTFSSLASPASAAVLRGLAKPGSVAPVLLSATTVTAALAGTFTGSGALTSEQVSGMIAGETYCEIDDAAFPTGEIRGQLAVPVPSPAEPWWGVAGLAALLGFAGAASRRRRSMFGT
jgi:MYXO-CTERM domain-containing protein